jgi:hypothetical protein
VTPTTPTKQTPKKQTSSHPHPSNQFSNGLLPINQTPTKQMLVSPNQSLSPGNSYKFEFYTTVNVRLPDKYEYQGSAIFGQPFNFLTLFLNGCWQKNHMKAGKVFRCYSSSKWYFNIRTNNNQPNNRAQICMVLECLVFKWLLYCNFFFFGGGLKIST